MKLCKQNKYERKRYRDEMKRKYGSMKLRWWPCAASAKHKTRNVLANKNMSRTSLLMVLTQSLIS